MIAVISAVNFIGIRQGNTLQAAFTAGKILLIVFIVAAGFGLGARLPEHFVSGGAPGARISWTGFLNALVAGLFAFGGWHMVTYSAGETDRPERTIPRALMIGTGIVTAAYIALNTVYMYVLPLDKVASSTRIAADAADALVGSGGGAFLSAIVVFSTFGALAGIILSGPRVYFAMAKDGLLFSWLGRTHPRFGTPAGRDPPPGRLVVRPGRDRELSRPVHPRRLHGMDLLRRAGRRPPSPPPAGDRPSVQPAHPRAVDPDPVRPVLSRDRRPTDRSPTRAGAWPGSPLS